jgi:parallel beta-helix repeat protein
MGGRIQTRRDWAVNWLLTNPVLADGELALELDSGLFKIGDGITHWATLEFAKSLQPEPHVSSHAFDGVDPVTIEDLDAQLNAALPETYGADRKFVTQTELANSGIVTVVVQQGAGTVTPLANHHYIVTGDVTLQNPVLPASGLWKATLGVAAGVLITFPNTWKLSGYQDVSAPCVISLSVADGTTVHAQITAYAYTTGAVGSRVHVAKWGNDSNSGFGWASAKLTVTAGAILARSLSAELWIAEGTYIATTDNGFDIGGITTYGGFAGTETTVAERVSTAVPNNIGSPLYRNETVLSNPITVRSTAKYICTTESGAVSVNGISFKDSICVVMGVAQLTNCLIADNHNNWTGTGVVQHAILYNCTLRDNRVSGNGGGAYYCAATRCLFQGNIAQNYGGGVEGGTYTTCAFNYNKSLTNMGGGAYNGTFLNCSFTGNESGVQVGARSGGGLASSTFETTAIDCTFTSNTASGGGGAYSVTLLRCTFTSNVATSSYGGGSYNCPATYCTYLYNTCTGGYGGGAYSGTLTINCIFIGNTASSHGGGLYVGTSGHIAYNCVVARCTGASSRGGLGLTTGATAVNCTIIHNNTFEQTASFKNCIAWRNVTETGTGGLNLSNAASGIAIASFVNAPDVPASIPANNVEAFDAAVLAHGYDLAAGAVAINAGNDTYTTMTTDIRGRTRKVGTVDTGAYEYQA